ncbi:hypothetical protein BC940DRAFT_301955 [Gongronella butleri]|nr:hypothetical protein BC940DRAFT_301955 [Gongronella butleri]
MMNDAASLPSLFPCPAQQQPASAPTSMKQKTRSDHRPVSDNMKRQQNESWIDKLTDDLQQQHQHTIEALAHPSLDPDVQDEIKYVDNWFKQLGETERTVMVYTLLQHSTALQARFFMTILQQIGTQHPLHSWLATTNSANSNGKGEIHEQRSPRPDKDRHRHSLGSASKYDPFCQLLPWDPVAPLSTQESPVPESVQTRSISSGSTSHGSTSTDSSSKALCADRDRLGPEKKGGGAACWPPSHGGGAPCRQSADLAHWSSAESSVAMDATPWLPPTLNHVDHHMAPWTAAMLVSPLSSLSLHDSPSPPSYLTHRAISNTANGSPLANLTPPSLVTRSPPPPQPSAFLPTSYSHDQRRINKQRYVRSVYDIDMSVLRDVPSWLRSLRLHKYTTLLDKMPWQDLIKLSDDQLLAKGVVALGARNKLLRAFECARDYCDSKNIVY